jgi:hypothetical protein
MSNNNGLQNQAARVTSAIAGIQKYFPAAASLVLAGTAYTPAQIIALFQAFADAIKALVVLHAQLSSGVLAVRSQRKQIQKVLLALESYVDNLFGSDPGKLGDFGFTPKQSGVVSTRTRALAIVKGKATRAARHTMGSKQKAAITGDSTGSSTPAVTQTGAIPTTPKV